MMMIKREAIPKKMKISTYVEALHEVVKNRNRQDDGEENWRRDGDDC